MASGPIIVVGANGTGSTLLRLMLDSHERIAIPGETGFLRLAAMHRWVPYWSLGGSWSASLGLTDEARDAALAGFYGGLLSAYAQSRGKPRWGEKTPFHVWHLQLARRMFPDCQVVGIVRHPGAVVSSQRRRFRRTYSHATRGWLRSTARLVHEAMALGDQCVLLRYEDLVSTPEPAARALLEWLGEDWSEAVLDHHEIQASNVAEGFTDAGRAIDAAAVTEWEAHLRGDERRQVLAPTSTLASFLGYDVDRTLPLGEFGDGLLVTGTALRARYDARAVTIKRPRAGYADRPLRPPVPRARRTAVDLDDVTIRALLQHRMARLAHRLPSGPRARLNAWRRRSALLDRLAGPRR